MDEKVFSKIGGAFIGTALGDGLGEYPHLLKVEGEPIPPTDDTLMTLTLAKVVFSLKTYDPQKVAQAYYHLYREGKLTKIGWSTFQALKRFEKYRNWFYSGVINKRAAGNGVAMRVAPLGIFAYLKKLPLEDFYETVRREGYITHRNELAISGAFAVAYAVYLNLEGNLTPTGVVEETLHLLEELGIENPVKEALELSLKKVDLNPKEALTSLGTSGYVVHTVASAFYLFLKMDNFLEGLKALLEVGGDTDTIGAIYGALYGSYFGMEKFPQNLVNRLETLPEIEEILGLVQRKFA